MSGQNKSVEPIEKKSTYTPYTYKDLLKLENGSIFSSIGKQNMSYR